MWHLWPPNMCYPTFVSAYWYRLDQFNHHVVQNARDGAHQNSAIIFIVCWSAWWHSWMCNATLGNIARYLEIDSYSDFEGVDSDSADDVYDNIMVFDFVFCFLGRLEFGSLYPRSHCVCHYPNLVPICQGWSTNQKLCLPAELSLNHQGPVQCLTADTAPIHFSVSSPSCPFKGCILPSLMTHGHFPENPFA